MALMVLGVGAKKFPTIGKQLAYLPKDASFNSKCLESTSVFMHLLGQLRIEQSVADKITKQWKLQEAFQVKKMR